jgi:hypothetical protein
VSVYAAGAAIQNNLPPVGCGNLHLHLHLHLRLRTIIYFLALI